MGDLGANAVPIGGDSRSDVDALPTNCTGTKTPGTRSPLGFVVGRASVPTVVESYSSCNFSQRSIAHETLIILSNTKSPPEEWLVRDGGRREILARNLGLAFG
jgi:hypothetical protein